MVKKLKDLHAPKRPLSGYFQWLNSGVRTKLLAEGMRLKDALRTCGLRWSALPGAQKNIWQEKSKREKAVYEAAMVEYKKTDSYAKFVQQKKEYDLKKVKGTKKPKDKNRPKQPLSAYFRFSQEFKKTAPSLKMTELSKKAAEKWKVLDAAEKKKYSDATAIEKAKYQKVLANYMKTDEYLQFQEKLNKFNMKKKKKMKNLMKVKSKAE